jgi:hypothetical protein
MHGLREGPFETVNLAFGQTPPRHRQERARLEAALTARMTETGTLPNEYMLPSDP